MKRHFFLVTIVFLSGCSTTLPTMSDGAQRIQVHRQTSNLLDKCRRLENVATKAMGSYSIQIQSPFLAAQNNAEVEAREIAAKMGADTIVFLQTDLIGTPQGFPPVATVQVQGIAFRCR